MDSCPKCGGELDPDEGGCPECLWTPRDDYEPPEPDGEAFRGGEAASFDREQSAHWRVVK